jgi:hypothetical protein
MTPYGYAMNPDSLFSSGILKKKKDGYGKTIDVGAYIKYNLFRDHRN